MPEAMPVRPCPTCECPTPRSRFPDALLYFYRCDFCGHIWHTPKDNPDEQPTTLVEGVKGKNQPAPAR